VRLRYEGPPRGRYARDVQSWQQPIAKAVTKTFREAAKMIESAGRANISAAGLGKRAAAGFRVFSFPRRQFSLNPALKGWHRFGYFNIFERGGTIPGKPLIWIPLPTAPAKIGGKRITPKLFVDQVGPLVSINRPGKPPLLAGQALRAVSAGRRATVGQLKTGARRTAARRAGGRGRRALIVPLFVGIPQAKIRKRLSISPIYDRVRARLGEIYLKQFEVEGKS
jgi:hypothetical protein